MSQVLTANLHYVSFRTHTLTRPGTHLPYTHDETLLSSSVPWSSQPDSCSVAMRYWWFLYIFSCGILCWYLITFFLVCKITYLMQVSAHLLYSRNTRTCIHTHTHTRTHACIHEPTQTHIAIHKHGRNSPPHTQRDNSICHTIVTASSWMSQRPQTLINYTN